MNDSLSIVSTNIIELRDALGLSQKKFSELINISTPTLVNIESGKKSFRFKSLNGVIDNIGISLSSLLDDNFIPPKNLREKLLKRYNKEPSIFVILNSSPSISYAIKYKVLNTDYLMTPRETKEIQSFLFKQGFVFKSNSVHLTLKRMPFLVRIEAHPFKKGTFLYIKR